MYDSETLKGHIGKTVVYRLTGNVGLVEAVLTKVVKNPVQSSGDLAYLTAVDGKHEFIGRCLSIVEIL